MTALQQILICNILNWVVWWAHAWFGDARNKNCCILRVAVVSSWVLTWSAYLPTNGDRTQCAAQENLARIRPTQNPRLNFLEKLRAQSYCRSHSLRQANNFVWVIKSSGTWLKYSRIFESTCSILVVHTDHETFLGLRTFPPKNSQKQFMSFDITRGISLKFFTCEYFCH